MTAFADMKGGEVLAHVRDVLLKIAADKRSYLEQSTAVRGAALLTDDDLGEVNALGAAADIVQYAVTAGQEALTKARSPPAWVMGMAAQARTALSAPVEGEVAQG